MAGRNLIARGRAPVVLFEKDFAIAANELICRGIVGEERV
jgi:hypothetical protein